MGKRFVISTILLMCMCYVQAQMHYARLGSTSNQVLVYDSDYVDVSPSFPGGERGLVNFINKTRNYPTEARENRVQGRVTCSVVVSPSGVIEGIDVIKSVCSCLDEEAVRIIKQMPRWQAGRHAGKNVHVRCVITIPFRL